MWIITKNFISGKSEDWICEKIVGVSSRDYNITDSYNKDCFDFRMKDADGEIYCQGHSYVLDSFAPLDDYGKGALGCTEIEYYHENIRKWVSL